MKAPSKKGQVYNVLICPRHLFSLFEENGCEEERSVKPNRIITTECIYSRGFLEERAAITISSTSFRSLLFSSHLETNLDSVAHPRLRVVVPLLTSHPQ